MKPLVAFLLALIFFDYTGAANPYPTLSDSARVSLITCEAGSELYSTFGHSGIRVTDSLNGFDIVFNYGAFRFDEPNFYWKFLQGTTDFYLVIERMPDFLSGYIEENRQVIETPLSINRQQQQKLFNYLMWNAEEENRLYRYDFFDNNCSTKIRDVFEDQLGADLKLCYDSCQFESDATMRTMLDTKLPNQPWIRLCFYLIEGAGSDIKASPRQQTFLPQNLYNAFEGGRVNNTPLCMPDKLLLGGIIGSPAPAVYTHPLIIITLALLLLCSSIFSKKKVLIRISLAVVFLVTGAVGCFLAYLWFATELQCARQNFDLLWAFPPNILIGLFVLVSTSNRLWQAIKWYGLFIMLLPLIFLLLPQTMYVGLYLWLAMAGGFTYYACRSLSD